MRAFLWIVSFVLVVACGSRQEGSAHPDPAPTPAPSEPATSTEPTPSADGQLVVGEDACTTDADCVPDGCCHPTACVARGHEPPCGGICTTDCRYGTLDCGGACLCSEGHCAARLSTPPVIGSP